MGRYSGWYGCLVLVAQLGCAGTRTPPPPPDVPPAEQHPVYIRKVCVDGYHRVLSKRDIREINEGLRDGYRRTEDIETALKPKLQKYLDAGYLLATMDVDEHVTKGTLKVHVDEGELNGTPSHEPAVRMNITGKQTDEAMEYLKRQVSYAATKPFNISHVYDVLNEDPNVASVDCDLSASGGIPQRGELEMNLETASPWHLALTLDNYQSPAVGSERLQVQGANTNVPKIGGTAGFRYNLFTGGADDPEFAGDDDFGLMYERPLNRTGTTVGVHFDRSSAPLVEFPLSELDVDSKTEVLSFTVRQPVGYLQRWRVSLSTALDIERNETELFGEPFGFAPDLGDGSTMATVFRVGINATRRTSQSESSLYSQVCFGLDAFGATVSRDEPEGQFVSWRNGINSTRLIGLGGTETTLVARGFVQLTPDRLLALEKASIGGFDSVRGYRESEQLTENAVIGSLEWQIPIYAKDWGKQKLGVALAPFIDAGYGWDRDQHDNPFLSGAGVGLLINPSREFSASAYWAYAFKDVKHEETSLQDQGFYFSVVYSPK